MVGGRWPRAGRPLGLGLAVGCLVLLAFACTAPASPKAAPSPPVAVAEATRLPDTQAISTPVADAATPARPTKVPPSPAATIVPTGTPSQAAAAARPAVPPATPALPPSPGPEAAGDRPLIAVDPGHGAREIGAVYVGASGRVELLEKDVNLAIAQRLAALLRDAGYRVLLTRAADVAVNDPPSDRTGDGKVDVQDDLQARLDLANTAGASLLLSIHNNGHPSAAETGSEVYYCQHRPYADQNRALANLLQGAFVRRLGEVGYQTRDRGTKGDEGFRVINGIPYHASLLGPAQPPRIARPSEMPAVIGESLFLTNREGALLARADVQEAIAHAYLDAVEGFFALYPVR